jgi:hypothetical protein
LTKSSMEIVVIRTPPLSLVPMRDAAPKSENQMSVALSAPSGLPTTETIFAMSGFFRKFSFNRSGLRTC